MPTPPDALIQPGLILPPLGEKGVAVARATAVHIDIHKEVARVLTGVKPGATMAALSITTDAGVNLAIAHKKIITSGPDFLKGGEWGVELWIGKSGWDRTPPAGGVQIMFSK